MSSGLHIRCPAEVRHICTVPCSQRLGYLVFYSGRYRHSDPQGHIFLYFLPIHDGVCLTYWIQ